MKEIEPWGIYEQTAWDYVRTMVEEEERHKLLHKNSKEFMKIIILGNNTWKHNHLY